MECILSEYRRLHSDLEVVSGGASGADYIAEQTCYQLGIDVTVHYAEWDIYGKRAGYLRNKTIVHDCDEVVALWDGVSRGTQHTINYAKSQNKRVLVITYEDYL